VLAVALAGCVALNADPFALGNRFLKDEAIKQAVITRAGKAPPAGGDPVAATARQVDAVAELELPFGWAPVNRPHGTSEWLGKLLGWLVAAISIPLGASFWFDVLSRISRQRATGRREGVREDETRRPIDRDDPGATGAA
jgi:hypothetical protein